MKPTTVVLVLAIGAGLCCAAAGSASLWAQQRGANAVFIDAALLTPSDHFGPVPASEHFWTVPAPWEPRVLPEIPDAFLWADYRGAYIEHDLYRPRYLTPPFGGSECSRPALSGFGSWLDSLVSWMPFHRTRVCYTHSGGICPPAESMLPMGPLRQDEPAGAEPAETLFAPVPAPDIPSGITPIHPGPLPSVQIEAAPRLTVPVERPPANVVPALPPRLLPPRTPVVELAPAPVLPVESQPAPTAPRPLPRNRVPRPGEQLPRNGIPRT